MDNNCRTGILLTILVALAAEAKALSPGCRDSTAIIQCGIGRDAVVQAATSRLSAGTMVGNIGVSGGLAPDLVPGTIIIGERIFSQGDGGGAAYFPERYPVTGYLVDALEKVLQENMIPFRRGSLLCTNDPITLPEAKAAAWQQSGALAVDLESAGAAEAAARAGLPFFVFRVVCDPAGRRLVRELFAGVDSQGNSCPAHLLKPLARRPWLLVSLCRMARDFSVALASMERVWRVIRQPLVEQASSRISGPDL